MKKQWIRTGGILWFALVFGGGCLTTSLPLFSDLEISRSRPFVIANTPEPLGFGFLTHTWISPIRDQSFFVAYNKAGDGGGRNKHWHITKDLGPAFTTDGGETWALNTYSDEIKELYYRPSLIRTKEGEFRYDHHPKKSPNRNDKKMYLDALWVKDGAVVRKSKMIPLEMFGAPPGYKIFMLLLEGVELDNGDLILAGIGQHVEPDKSGSGRNVIRSSFLLRSTSGGTRFKFERLIASNVQAHWGREGCSESSLTKAANGDLILVSRTGSSTAHNNPTAAKVSPMLLSRSTDGGKTWTYEKMKFGGVWPQLLTMSNGLIALGYGRPGNHVVFSQDHGKTWGNRVTLSPNSAKSSGYCDILEISPGRLFACYDIFDTPQSGVLSLWNAKSVNTVWGRYIDVVYVK